MKKIYALTPLLFLGLAAHAQVFWTEDFGTGCNRAQAASAYTGTNGAWTETSTGTNDPYANNWYVSATASGTSANTCSASCLSSNTQNQSLHIGNPQLTIPSVTTIGADTGSTYLTGVFCGFGYCSVTNKRVESPVINCTGQSVIMVSFLYYEGSEAADDATFVYSPDGGTTWSTVNALAKTTNSCPAPAGTWTLITIQLPGSADNNPMVKIGFNWTNNASGGTDPSCAFDDITLMNTSMGIQQAQTAELSLYASGHGQITINPNGQAYKVIGVYDMLGQEVKFNNVNNLVQLTNAQAGIYIITVEVNGVRMTRKVLMD